MKKLEFKPRKLDEEIVRDGLCAVSALEDVSLSRGLYFVVGGVATQSYLPTSCRRPTSDIDLAILRQLGSADFRAFARPAEQYLNDHGYQTELKKGHNSYHLIYSIDSSANVIEFARHGQAHFEKVSGRLAEEYERARRKIVEERYVSCPFASPEDIATPKLVRSINSLERNPSYRAYLSDRESLLMTDKLVSSKLSDISSLREEAMVHIGDTDLSQRLRYVSDLYDIRILAEIAGFNEYNLKQAVSRWDTFVNHPEECALLFGYCLPTFTLFFEEFK